MDVRTLTPTQKRKIRTALKANGTTPIIWRRNLIWDMCFDLNGNEAREMLAELMCNGCKPVTNREAWTELTEFFFDNLSDYTADDASESEAIQVMFGPLNTKKENTDEA